MLAQIHKKTVHKKSSHGALREVLADKPEDERKYKIGNDADYLSRHGILARIFNFVVEERDHFQLLDRPVYTDGLDPEVVEAAKTPGEDTPIKITHYWATEDLDGYRSGDKRRAELRTQKKEGKGAFEQVLKIARGFMRGHTLSRGEHKRLISGFGIYMGAYNDREQKAVREVIGDKALKPLVHLQVQSRKFLYHPDGRKDIQFEIKFDSGKGWTFDGFKTNIVEIEIEVKEHGANISKKTIEKLLNKSEKILFGMFSDQMEPIFEPKAMALFRHLVGWMQRDSKGFSQAWGKLKRDPWRTPPMQNQSHLSTHSVQ